MAYVSAGLLWAVPVTPAGEAAGPARRLTNEIADDPSWSGDSRSILYIASDRLRRVWLHEGHTGDIPVDLTWNRERRTGTTLVRAGALFDGASDELRRNVDIMIRGNRIIEVADTDPARTADRVVDASDGVVVPGFIEMHTHGGLAMGEQLGRLWLSFGVTSIRSPASDPHEIVEARESVASGKRVGPRFFGTGGTIDGSRIYYAGAPSLSSTAQVELELDRVQALEHDMVKTYVRLADPIQRRVIDASHAMGLPVSSHELYPAVAYGADGVEHVKGTSRRGYSTKVSELLKPYDDVVTLLGASGMTLTPTVGIYGAYQLLAADSPTMFDDPRVQIFFPWAPQAAGVPDDMGTTRFLVENMASMARRVVEAGGTVIIGTDSPIIPQGFSYHAEMEALVKYGGMQPIDVLRSGTSLAAAALGYEDSLGRVAPGYYADLVVLNQNPLDDIRATRTTRIVVKDGRVFELRELLERDQ
jgi:imidazolonepropionase-like amidohydrolase